MKNSKEIMELRQVSRQLVRELGMLQLDQSDTQETPAYWHSLIEIGRDPGISSSNLAKRLLLSTPSMSRLIKRLTEQKLVLMQTGQDKREKILNLSDEGTKALQKIDSFSEEKILGAFEFLSPSEIEKIIQSIGIYAQALEKSRQVREQVKIFTLSTSRMLRRQVVNMITDIQKNEFSIPVTDEINQCVLNAEEAFCYHNSCNFWYATDHAGNIIGCVGLKKVDEQYAEIKKFFVASSYRGKGIAQQLMATVIKTAIKHEFKYLVLGTVDILQGAQKFYTKSGFTQIPKDQLPSNFDICPLDTVFFKAEVSELKHIGQ